MVPARPYHYGLFLTPILSGLSVGTAEQISYPSLTIDQMIEHLKKTSPLSHQPIPGTHHALFHNSASRFAGLPSLVSSTTSISHGLRKRRKKSRKKPSKNPNQEKLSTTQRNFQQEEQRKQEDHRRKQLPQVGFRKHEKSKDIPANISSHRSGAYLVAEEVWETEDEDDNNEDDIESAGTVTTGIELANSYMNRDDILSDLSPVPHTMKIRDHPTNFLNLVGMDFQPYRLVNIWLVLCFMMYMLVTQGYMMWVYGLSFRAGASIIQGLPGVHYIESVLAAAQQSSGQLPQNLAEWAAVLAPFFGIPATRTAADEADLAYYDTRNSSAKDLGQILIDTWNRIQNSTIGVFS